ncbi:MAG: PAS domain S-box protein, partial [Halobacteriales archaeon]
RERRERQLWLKNRAMDEAPVGITISDPDREDNPLTYVNDHFLALTGYDRDEVIGRNCRFLQGEDTREEPIAEMARAVDEEEPVTVELRNYRKDGTEFWNQVTIAPIRDDGEVTHYVGFQMDVTDRKERERRLRIYRRAIEEATDLIAAVDDDLRFLFANPAYRAFHGLDADAVTDRTLPEVLGPETFGTVVPHLQRAREGETVRYRMRRSLPDGPTHTFDIRYYPLETDDGDVEGVVATMHDVTELEARDRHLRTLDRLLRHNLRNELNLVLGQAELLADAGDEAVTRRATEIRAATDRLLAQADKEREIVELLSGPPTVEAVSVGTTVERAVAEVKKRHPDADVGADPGGDPELETVPEIERAVAELVENAVVHAGEEPTVTVTVADAGEAVAIEVEDDGPGIPPDERAVIAGDVEVDALLHASGMGLWLVDRIVTRAGGSLHLEDTDQGCRARIVLPRNRDDDRGDLHMQVVRDGYEDADSEG